MRRICVVTGTRAEYGLLAGLITALEEAPDVIAQLLVTGAHLSQAHGNTQQEILDQGHRLDARVDILTGGDTPQDVAQAMGVALSEGARALAQLEPDLLVVLGDRYEIFAIASAALILGIPIAHIHGGEVTEAAVDDSLRHAITKMSSLHFVAALAYQKRVIQMGESPERVFLVGGLGPDVIARTPLMSREDLVNDLGIDLSDRALMVTYHPETVQARSSQEQVGPLLQALDAVGPDVTVVFTMPNADAGGLELRALIEAFAANRENVAVFDSLGSRRYLSLLAQVDAVVGNSSSGLGEAPTFEVPSVNIGDRQAGRLRARSVIDCPNDALEIESAIRRGLSPDFRESLRGMSNPYGDGGATDRIVDVLRHHRLEGLTRKAFHDM